VTGQAALDPNTGTYAFLGPRRRAGKMNEYSLFMQDSWRATPALTINAGMRWDVQMPFSPVNDVMTTVTIADICGRSGLGNGGTYSKCNFYAPGATDGKYPEFTQFKKGNLGYNTDWNNIAPNIGVAWRPNVQSGWLRGLLGDPELATLRGGYSIAYERQGMAVFTGQFGPNPGSTLSLTRNDSTGLGQGPTRRGRFCCGKPTGCTTRPSRRLRPSRFWPERIGPIVFTMPEDVILNTRRAFSVSTTTLTGYSSSLGVPEGRYFAPANSADCIQLKTGDCAPRTLMVRAPFFSRFDIGVTKKFPIHGNVNFELRADVLNAFDNMNFNVTDASRTPGSGASIFQSGSAYSDLSNVFDPGGRLGQLVFRLNW
jgi:hypothetical protein